MMSTVRLREFSGDPSLNVLHWLRSVEALATANAWTEQQQLCHALASLTGSASYWLDSVSICSWQELRASMISRFGESVETVLHKLHMCKQQYHESVLAYIDRFRQLSGQLASTGNALSDALLLSIFVSGTCSRLRRALVIKHPHTLEEAIADAKYIDGSLDAQPDLDLFSQPKYPSKNYQQPQHAHTQDKKPYIHSQSANTNPSIHLQHFMPMHCTKNEALADIDTRIARLAARKAELQRLSQFTQCTGLMIDTHKDSDALAVNDTDDCDMQYSEQMYEMQHRCEQQEEQTEHGPGAQYEHEAIDQPIHPADTRCIPQHTDHPILSPTQNVTRTDIHHKASGQSVTAMENTGAYTSYTTSQETVHPAVMPTAHKHTPIQQESAMEGRVEMQPKQGPGPGEQWQQPEESKTIYRHYHFTPFGRLQSGSIKASPAVVKDYGQEYGATEEQANDSTVKKPLQKQRGSFPETKDMEQEDNSTIEAFISSSNGENPYQQQSRPPDRAFKTAKAVDIDEGKEAVRQDRGIQASEEQLRSVGEKTTYSKQQEPRLIEALSNSSVQVDKASEAAAAANQYCTSVQTQRDTHTISAVQTAGATRKRRRSIAEAKGGEEQETAKFAPQPYKRQSVYRAFQDMLVKPTEPATVSITQLPAARVFCDRPRPVPMEYKRNLEDAAADLRSFRSQQPYRLQVEDFYTDLTTNTQEEGEIAP